MTTKKKTEQQKVMEIIERHNRKTRFYFARRGELQLKIWIIPTSNGEGMWRGVMIISEGDHVCTYSAQAGGYGYNKLTSILNSLIFDASRAHIFSIPSIHQYGDTDEGFFRSHGFEVVAS